MVGLGFRVGSLLFLTFLEHCTVEVRSFTTTPQPKALNPVPRLQFSLMPDLGMTWRQMPWARCQRSRSFSESLIVADCDGNGFRVRRCWSF